MADPPWFLRGEGLLAWARRPPRVDRLLPPGLAPMAGPAAVVAVRYDDSPVGPYLELSVAVPARLGLRPGLYVVAMAVTSADARLACRSSWDLPAELGSLRWAADGDDREMAWEERGLTLRGRASGPAVPVRLPLRSLLWRPGGAAVAARRVRAQARGCRCAVELASTDELAWLAGRHPGALLSGLSIVAAAARRPAGLVSSIPWRERAVPGAPEPAG